MIKKFTERWVSYMVANGAPESEREVYAYGLECMLNELMSDVLLLLCALLLHLFWEMVVWIATFTLLRVNVGGFHASSHHVCIISSIALGVFCVLAYPILEPSLCLSALVASGSLIAVYLSAPVVHPNHPVTQRKKKSARRWAILIAWAETVLAAACCAFYPALSAVILTGLSSAAALGFLGHVRQREVRI